MIVREVSLIVLSCINPWILVLHVHVQLAIALAFIENAKLWCIISPRWLLRLTHGGLISESIPTIRIRSIRALCESR